MSTLPVALFQDNVQCTGRRRPVQDGRWKSSSPFHLKTSAVQKVCDPFGFYFLGMHIYGSTHSHFCKRTPSIDEVGGCGVCRDEGALTSTSWHRKPLLETGLQCPTMSSAAPTSLSSASSPEGQATHPEAPVHAMISRRAPLGKTFHVKPFCTTSPKCIIINVTSNITDRREGRQDLGLTFVVFFNGYCATTPDLWIHCVHVGSPGICT